MKTCKRYIAKAIKMVKLQIDLEEELKSADRERSWKEIDAELQKCDDAEILAVNKVICFFADNNIEGSELIRDYLNENGFDPGYGWVFGDGSWC